jgi:hypothetical protein
MLLEPKVRIFRTYFSLKISRLVGKPRRFFGSRDFEGEDIQE